MITRSRLTIRYEYVLRHVFGLPPGFTILTFGLQLASFESYRPGVRSTLGVADHQTASDQLPTSVKELKETKSGLVAYLYLVGKDKDAIAKELKAAFKLNETQAVKITRRITGRVRLYKRVLDLVPAKA